MVSPQDYIVLKMHKSQRLLWFSGCLFLLMIAGLMDVISHHNSRLRQSLEHTVCMVLFKIFFNVLFSLCRPVDSAFYLICPKHTSLIFAAGCVRGSVSLPLHWGCRPDFHGAVAPLGGLQRAAYQTWHPPPSSSFTPAPTPTQLCVINIHLH